MTDRRLDLDWLRIGAFALLIIYHIGMVFVPWDFHIKTAHPLTALEAPMLLLNPWRLPLLFVISGCASRFLLEKAGTGFAASRSARLLMPLVFAVVIVVPPQAWVDVVLNHDYRQGFAVFWTRDYWRFDASLGVVVPTYNHLWFVAYLWIYTMIVAAIALVLPSSAAPTLQRAFDRLFDGWGVALVPLVALAMARILLVDRFPETHALIDDWYMHLVYGACFAFGIGLAASRTAWAAIARLWRWAALAALVGWAIVVHANILADTVELSPLALGAARTMRTVQMWGAILALLGLAHRYLNFDHRWRVILNEAVFPAYIAHQTIIILAEYGLRPLALPAWGEFAVLLPVTVIGSAAVYLIGHRIGWLRPLIGLSRVSKDRPSTRRSVGEAATTSRDSVQWR